MKKNIIVTFVLALLLSCGLTCNHEHTEECGKNGVDCTHQCWIIQPKETEKPRH